MATILAFHAHPDDESVSTGVTLAKYADEGHRVVVVTATDGSAGEIHNYENPEELFPKLAEMRKEELEKSLDAKSVPQAILILAGYQYKSAFVADQEINMVACLTEIMANCKFK